MMTFYRSGEPGVACVDLDSCPVLTQDAVWIDLFEPSREEEKTVEAALGFEVPTREEMQKIEISSRLYRENDIPFMTATVLNKADTSHPEGSAVTFILAPRQLVTVRYADPAPFQNFRKRIETSGKQYDSPGKVFEGLIDAIVERLAEILEKVGSALDSVSLEVFTPSTTPSGGKAPRQDFDKILRRVGRCSDLVSKARESLVSLGRLLLFFNETPKPESHTKTVLNDLTSLSDHASFLSTKVNFLLDATLGLINIEQNGIIKIVSVAAVVFLPPTLVASVYGMNFDVMPELKWVLGYPFAVFLMISTAVLPYVFFKRKGWL